jgi:hypothetical protein
MNIAVVVVVVKKKKAARDLDAKQQCEKTKTALNMKELRMNAKVMNVLAGR